MKNNNSIVFILVLSLFTIFIGIGTVHADSTVLYNDGTLIINEKDEDSDSNTEKHGNIIVEYDPISNENNYVFAQATDVPWYYSRDEIKNIEIGQIVKPISTAYWFSDCSNLTFANLEKLDTSKVTSMIYMFDGAGYNTTTFELKGLSNWDTSKVIDMSRMFSYAGYNATTFKLDNLSSWDTSQVTNMSSMFFYSGNESMTWNIGDLSSWDTSQVTDMSDMFKSAGEQNATTFNIGNLSGWNTSKVTDMSYLFSRTGTNASVWNIGDLSNWDTSQVVSMIYMFEQAGYNATSWSIGDLSNWDTSQVTRMNSMFKEAGYNATSWSIGDLSNWNTLQVTDMGCMFCMTGYNSNKFNNIGNIRINSNCLVDEFAYKSRNFSGNIEILGNLKFNSSKFGNMFYQSSTNNDALVNISYTNDNGKANAETIVSFFGKNGSYSAGNIQLKKYKISKTSNKSLFKLLNVSDNYKEINESIPLDKVIIKPNDSYSIKRVTIYNKENVDITSSVNYNEIEHTFIMPNTDVNINVEFNNININSCSISGIVDKTYTGSAITQNIKVLIGKEELDDSNYDVTYDKNTNVGTATLTITGKGNYTGTITKTFKINPIKITASNTKVTGIANKVFNSKNQTQSIKVTYNGKNVPVRISYKNNKNIGTATVTITAYGNYTGTITKSFRINPGKVTIKSLKPYKKSLTVKRGAIAGGVKYQIAYKQKGTNKWKYVNTTKTTTKIKKLKSKKKYYVKIRAYKVVNKVAYYGNWSGTKTVKVK